MSDTDLGLGGFVERVAAEPHWRDLVAGRPQHSPAAPSHLLRAEERQDFNAVMSSVREPKSTAET